VILFVPSQWRHPSGQEGLQRITSSLHIATISGVRSTTPGEPFPEDVRLEKHASEVLNTLSRWDPAYELYAGLLRSAKSGIEWQRREKEPWTPSRKNSAIVKSERIRTD